MPNRTKTAASPIFAAFLASVFSTAIAFPAARAADDCLSEPKHQTPPGGHWYYRIDGPNHRKCWFLGDEGQKVSQAGSPRPSSPLPLPRRTAAAIQPSVADAHAELPKVTTPTEPPQWFGPTRMNPEKITEVVPDASPSETLSPPSARDPEGETRVMSNGVIDGESRTESRTELLPRATCGGDHGRSASRAACSALDCPGAVHHSRQSYFQTFRRSTGWPTRCFSQSMTGCSATSSEKRSSCREWQ